MTRQQRIDAHILKCVYANAAIPYDTSIGASKPQTVQELLQQNVSTLRKIGKKLEQQAAQHGGSKFETQSRLQIPARSGIYADDWLEFLLLLIEDKEIQEAVENKNSEIKALRAQIDSMKDKSEIRKELEEKLAKLEGKLAEPAQ